MKSVEKYLYLAIILFLGIVCIIFHFRNNKEIKAHSETKQKYIILSDKWNKLLTQPPRVVYVKIPVTVENNNPIVPKPITYVPTKTDTLPKTPDTIYKDCPKNSYAETYDIGDSIHIFWTAQTKGIIEQFNVPRITYPQTYITKTIYIPPDPVDTNAIVKRFFKKVKWGAGGSVGLQDFKFEKFPGFKARVFMEINRKIILAPEISYFDNTTMIWFSVDFYFNRKK